MILCTENSEAAPFAISSGLPSHPSGLLNGISTQ